VRRQDFHFELPAELIAQRPSERRGGSRLMRVPLEGERRIEPFAAIVEAFRGDELLIINDTQVVPARVRGAKPTGGAVEVFFVEPLDEEGLVLALVRGKRLKVGSTVVLPLGVRGELARRRDDGTMEVALTGLEGDLWSWLDQVGEVPLPPYIDRRPDAQDAQRYQTVYAATPGAVAAPTAGLHFTPELLDALRAKGCEIHTLTLHVGLGTFLPVREDDLSAHRMHSERFSIPPATRRALATGRPVVAVGTTVVRALEADAQAHVGRTDIFITPGYAFRVVDGLLTNFHLPESTLLMLVSAFAGHARVRAAYDEAVAEGLRFYSYGDAMLLRREGGRWT
jgi:S-adenosylmethionine:tRNA ribosyltransferase-isomerase